MRSHGDNSSRLLVRDLAQAKQLMHDAHTKCLIANSMRCEVVVDETVEEA
ncbi:MAG: hypothetical protein ACYC2H_04800 [Thermoplasmatota archaeon]